MECYAVKPNCVIDETTSIVVDLSASSKYSPQCFILELPYLVLCSSFIGRETKRSSSSSSSNNNNNNNNNKSLMPLVPSTTTGIFFHGSTALRGPRLCCPVFEITLRQTTHSVGFLWTSDQPITETSNWQNRKTHTRHPCPRRDSDP